MLVPTPSPVQPHHDVHSVASHVSGGLAGVRAFRPCWGHRRAASSAHLKTDPGSQQEADIVHVREGDTDAWPSIPFAPSWAGTQCSQQGVCSSAAILLPSMACSAGGPLRRRHRVIALLADRQGRSRVVRSTSSFVAGIDRVRRSSENTASGDVGSARTISESSSHVVGGPGH